MIYTPDFKVAEITLDGVAHRCIIKEVQFHPVSEKILHIDFLKLEADRPVQVEVPVRFEGSSPGVKVGGTLQQTLRRVKIKTTPENLVDQLFVDISDLELGHSARVRDLKVPNGIEVMNASGIPVVSVVVPRALRSATAEEGEQEEEVVAVAE